MCKTKRQVARCAFDKTDETHSRWVYTSILCIVCVMSVDFEVKSVYLLVSVFIFILVLQTKLYHAQYRSLSVQ